MLAHFGISCRRFVSAPPSVTNKNSSDITSCVEESSDRKIRFIENYINKLINTETLT